MPFDYIKSKTTADRLIEAFGQIGAIRRNGVADTPAIFVITDYRPTEADGRLIQYTDKRVYLSDPGFEPEQRTDLLIVGTTLMDIISVKPLNPAGVVVFYELQVRR